MGSSDYFSLRWNDYESNIISSLQDLRKKNELFDVTLCCDNGLETVQAHRVILSACSPLFRSLFSHANDQKQILLYLKDVRLKELNSLLDFMYNGEVSVNQDDLSRFLSAADELSIKGLTSDNDFQKSNSRNANSEKEDHVSVEDLNQTLSQRRKVKKSNVKRERMFNEDLEADEKKRIKNEILEDPDNDMEIFDNDEDYDPSFENYESVGTTSGKAGGRAPNPETKDVLEEARFSRTKQGNALLIDKAGYCYLINRKSEKKIYWKCQKKTAKECRSNCQTEGFYIIKKTAEHSHPPYPPPRNKYTEDY